MADRWPRLPLPPATVVPPELEPDDDLFLVEEPADPALEWETRKTQRVSKEDYDRMREAALAEIAGGLPTAPVDSGPRDTLKTLPIETSETIPAAAPETIPPPTEMPEEPPPYLPPDPILIASPDPRRAPVERAARRLGVVMIACALLIASAILGAALHLR
jgi:hypothetical protein